MKITKLLLLCLVVVLSSCSNDDNNATTADIAISGKFLAPNGVDPIVNGTVTALREGTVVTETNTSTDGKFTLSGLKENVTYNLQLKKGLFSSERELTVRATDTVILDIPIDSLPRIGVVTGFYDNIESVLYDIGLVNPVTGAPLFDIIDGSAGAGRYDMSRHHGHSHTSSTASRSDADLAPNVDFSFGDLIADPTMLEEYDILFLNCGLNEDHITNNDNLLAYVQNGGILYATDYAYVYLDAITNGGADYIDFYDPERTGSSLATEATIFDPDLVDWLEINFGIDVPEDDTILIDEFLPGWQVVDSYDNASVITWFNGPVEYRDMSGMTVSENKDLAFTFLVGQGGVFYSSFHTENHDSGFSTVDRLMEYLVFELSAL